MLEMHVRAAVAVAVALVGSVLANHPGRMEGQPVDVLLGVGIVRVERGGQARTTITTPTMNGTERVSRDLALVKQLEKILPDRLIRSATICNFGMLNRQELLQLSLLFLCQPVEDIAMDMCRPVVLLV